MTHRSHYHLYLAKHRPTHGAHARPKRRHRLTAKLMLLWVSAWAAADARNALAGA